MPCTGLGWRGGREVAPGLPSPLFVVEKSVGDPPVLVAVVTTLVGAAGISGKVTFGAVKVKSSKSASRAAVLKAAWQIPTWSLTPTQSARTRTPPGVAPLVI